MHSSHHLPLLLWLPLLMLLATSGTAGALTKEEKVLVVDAHNKYRSQTNPPAANMLRMNWDEKLASIATGYAKKCIWAHNPDRGRVGENLYAISGNGLDVQKATTDWYQELDFYNFTTGVCQQGKMCGHYTQVVWAKSEKIGCGSHLCPKLKNVPESNVHILVCNYAPPGNVVGEQLYEVGPPCSACPAGYPCEQSLCGPSRGPEEPQDLPCPVTEAQTSLATETSGSSTLGAPLSLVTEAPSFLVTEGPVPLATKTLPAVQTEAPSSLVTKDLPSSGAKEAPSSLSMKSPLSMAMEATPSETTEVPAFGATHSLLSLFEKTVTIPISTQAPSPKSEDKGTGRTRAPSQSPERSLTPKMPLIGTPQPLLHAQKTGAVGPHQWAAPSEVSASVLPAPDDPCQEPATLVHLGHTSSRALPHLSTPSAPAQAVGGRVLALHSSLPVSDVPEEESIKAPEKPSPAGSNPGMPNPLKPSAEETVIPLGPGVTGLIPAGPSVEGINLAEPGATGPISMGPSVEESPIALGPDARGLIPAGPRAQVFNPTGFGATRIFSGGLSLQGTTIPLEPGVTGLIPVGPSEEGLNPTGPGAIGPISVGPSVEEPTIPLGSGATWPIPAGPSVEGPQPVRPSGTGSILVGRYWTEPNAIIQSLGGLTPTVMGSDPLTPAELEEPNPQNIESLDQKMPEETVVEESKEENPDQGESYWDEPYEEEPDIDDINEDQFYEEDELKLTRQNPGIRKPTVSKPAGPAKPKPAVPKPAGPAGPKPAVPKPAGPAGPKPAVPKPAGPAGPKPAVPKPAGPAGPKPAGPKPAGGPAGPKPAGPKPAGPKPAGGPAGPKPAGPKPAGGPAGPKPAASNPAAPNPAGPNPAAPQPTKPKFTLPKISVSGLPDININYNPSGRKTTPHLQPEPEAEPIQHEFTSDCVRNPLRGDLVLLLPLLLPGIF